MMSGAEFPLPTATLLGEWGLENASAVRIAQGLINRSYCVEQTGSRFVLQWLNPIFDACVNQDIDRVTRHLRSKRLLTLTIVPTLDGNLWVEDARGVWRMFEYIEGSATDSLVGPWQAVEAGRLLGEFHNALADFNETLANQRPPVHEFSRHLNDLDIALEKHSDHRVRPQVASLLAKLHNTAALIPAFTTIQLQIVHGDPKLSNLLFDLGARKGLCLIDLDTVTRMPLLFELGDALRSWCCSGAEDAERVEFLSTSLSNALNGYATAAPELLEPETIDGIVPAIAHICLELAARFLADALNESYFAWDPERFSSAADHQLARASNQLDLAGAVVADLQRLTDTSSQVFDALKG